MTPVSRHLYTADEVAELLNLHVKTIRRYVRDGRLKARRIGKEYRIARTDLDAFAGDTRPANLEVARSRQVTASTIVDVDVVSPEDSQRVTTMVMAALNSRKGEGDFPRVDSIYDAERATLRIAITGNAVVTCDLLRMINTLLEAGRGKHLKP
jgi:excisionase family DNA binding protein